MRRFSVLCLLLAGCADAAIDAPEATCAEGALVEDAAGSPRLDQVWQIATHNSYWVDRGTPGDAFASGTGERLADQVLYDHARALEIDIHKDRDDPHRLLVFHTEPGNSLCMTFEACLQKLREIHHAVPAHEVITVVLELKEITTPNFDDEHTPDDIDRAIDEGLGDLVYRPRDLLARCGAAPACPSPLGACAARAGWPTIAELRGKFIFALLGNWDELAAQGTKDWTRYALERPMAERSAFPMASSWKLEWDKLSPLAQQRVTQDELDRALAESPLLQIEDTADPRMPPFLEARGLVRIDGAFTPEDQAARIALGAQLQQTDFPWDQHDDRGPSEPFRPLVPGFPPEATVEPGDRILLAPGEAGEPTLALLSQPLAEATRWEATILSGRDADAVGCLVAMSSLGGGDSISLCRTKVSASLGSAETEQVVLSMETCVAGACTKEWVGGSDDLVSLLVDGDGQCAAVQTPLVGDPALELLWSSALPETCVGSPLAYLGIARPSGGEASIMFAGLRRNGVAVRATDFDADGAGLIDLSTP